MEVFHTAGDPPSSGSSTRPMIGCTENTSAAEVKIARANNRAIGEGFEPCGTAVVSVI